MRIFRTLPTATAPLLLLPLFAISTSAANTGASGDDEIPIYTELTSDDVLISFNAADTESMAIRQHILRVELASDLVMDGIDLRDPLAPTSLQDYFSGSYNLVNTGHDPARTDIFNVKIFYGRADVSCTFGYGSALADGEVGQYRGVELAPQRPVTRRLRSVNIIACGAPTDEDELEAGRGDIDPDEPLQP